MSRQASNILELIGQTPIVRLNRLNPHASVEIYLKLEYFNPGGSVKDRPALIMLEAAEASGELTHDKTVIEATSGNTGIGLAMVCAIKGYRLMLAMSESASLERKRILKALGAEILLTPAHLGTDGAIEEVYRMARENPEQYYLVDQFNNPDNPRSHESTCREIWEQTKGKVTMVVATMGTTGTLMGLYDGMKRFNPDIRIVGVEPFLGHGLQGQPGAVLYVHHVALFRSLREAHLLVVKQGARILREASAPVRRRGRRGDGLAIIETYGFVVLEVFQDIPGVIRLAGLRADLRQGHDVVGQGMGVAAQSGAGEVLVAPGSQ